MNIAQMNLQEALNAYTAERTTELMVQANVGASALQKHRAIMHRTDAEQIARKAGAMLDDLKAASEAAYKALAGPDGNHYKLVFEGTSLTSYKNGEPYSVVSGLSKTRCQLLEHMADWQKRGAELQLYDNEPEGISDHIVNITTETVGPYQCRHKSPGSKCEDSPDGTCSTCPHSGDMSKDKAGGRNETVG